VQGGRIGIIGVYVGFTNHFNIGGFMEKHMQAAGGQVLGCPHRQIVNSIGQNIDVHATQVTVPY
jgi:threonine dehydrogenase-like Zn-dependent dehydrogenase